MKLGQNACRGNSSDEFDGSGEQSRAIFALLLLIFWFCSVAEALFSDHFNLSLVFHESPVRKYFIKKKVNKIIIFSEFLLKNFGLSF
jgi:hypothetical protein